MRHARTRRPGNVAVVVAVCLTAILGVVALSLDAGGLLDKRRQAQAAADAAALAAASELYANWFSGRGLDNATTVSVTGCVPASTTGAAKAAARAAAAANGYADGVNGVTVAVNIPPLSGPNAGLAGHAEVVVTASQVRYFSRIFGSDAVTYGARAVGRGKRGGVNNGIIVLAPTGKGSFTTGGGANVTVSGAPLLVNSTDPQAMYANGGGTVTAPEFDVGGSPGWVTPGGGTFSGTIVPNSPPVPDPLANLPAPDPTTMTAQSKNKTQISGNGNGTVTLNPGVYVGGISITGQRNVVLNPGIYYMDGGGFNWGGGGSLTGNGVMIYNVGASNSDTISLSGNGAANMSPPTSGPYQGMLFFQSRTSTAPVGVTGNGSMSLTGTFYAAAAMLNVSGNGTNDVLGAQYISYNLTLGGNGSFQVSWSPDITPGIRQLYLVE